MEKFESNQQKEQAEKEKQKKLLLGCAGSLQDMLEILEEKKESKEKINAVKNLLEIVLQADAAGNLSNEFLEKMKYTTLATIDMIFLDEMVRDSDAAPIYQRRYGREYPAAYESYVKEGTEAGADPIVLSVFLDSNVLKRDMEALTEAGRNPNMRVWAYLGADCDDVKNSRNKNEKLSFVICDDISKLEELLQNERKKLIVLPKIIETSEEDERVCDTVHRFLEKEDFQNIVVAGFKITNKVGVMQTFEGDKLRLRSKIFTHLNLSKQEEILALMESGCSFLSTNEVDETDFEKGKTEDIGELSQDYFDKRLGDYIDSLANIEESVSDRYYRRKMSIFLRRESARGFLEKHEKHYKKFFAIEGKQPEEILLTNSGLSANNLAIKSLADRSAKKMKAHYQIGWYYDNVKIIKDYFQVTEKPDDAKVIFVNIDSCYPDDPDKFHSEQEKMISGFLAKAKANPNEKYSLVVDITADMLWGEHLEIPDNLELIKTFSATKYQHGGRNYFFGGVVGWNTEGLRGKMESNLDFLGGRLNSVGVVNYPRIGKEEVRKNMEHLKRLNLAFAKGVEEGSEIFPPEFRFKTYSYNYYTYIVLPPDFPRYPYLDLQELDFDGLAETGDSFGLEHTRVCFVPKSMRENEEALRFSPGFRETEERMYKLGLKLNLEWKKFVYKLKEEIENEKK